MWRHVARQSVTPWEIVKWPYEARLYVSQPDRSARLLTANLTTGAWTEYTGWDARCFAVYGRGVFFGSSNGMVYQAERGGNDDGAAYVSRIGLLPSDMGDLSTYKEATLMRATVASTLPYEAGLSVAANYSSAFPAAPASSGTADETPASEFDTGEWDVSRWDEVAGEWAVPPIADTGWTSVSAAGMVLAPQVQFVWDGASRPDTEVMAVEIMWVPGAPVA